jgi:hypothetical protein
MLLAPEAIRLRPPEARELEVLESELVDPPSEGVAQPERQSSLTLTWPGPAAVEEEDEGEEKEEVNFPLKDPPDNRLAPGKPRGPPRLLPEEEEEEATPLVSIRSAKASCWPP